MHKVMPRKIEISHKTIIFTIFLLLLLWFVFSIRDVIFQFFISVFIMIVLNPTVKKFHRRFKIPRAISVLIVYIITISIIVLSVASIAPPLLEQTTTFASNLPTYLHALGLPPGLTEQLNNELLSQIGSLPSRGIRFGVSVFSNILEVLTILIFAFYLLMSRDKLETQLDGYIGKDWAEKVTKFTDELETQLGGWARGELALMALVGVATYIGLVLLGLPYAIPLAIVAGLLEAVPYVGPIMAAVPSVIIGFGISPVMGFATIALAFLIQQVENYVFVPKVMERSVGMPPIVTLLALAIGFRMAGIGGALLSVPVVIILRIAVKQHLVKVD
jgi:predicted PurR-regulated permease PerM